MFEDRDPNSNCVSEIEGVGMPDDATDASRVLAMEVRWKVVRTRGVTL
jgi:hypothetical protein